MGDRLVGKAQMSDLDVLAAAHRVDWIDDPTERAKRAGEMLNQIGKAGRLLRDIRFVALRQLHREGLTYAQIAERLGISAARVGQIIGDTKPRTVRD